MAWSCLVQQPLKGSAKGSTRHTECAGWLVALCDGAATSICSWMLGRSPSCKAAAAVSRF